MTKNTFPFKKRESLIDRFNERVNTPSAYLDVPKMKYMVVGVEALYDVHISNVAVGHGALVLAALDGAQYSAVPFAMDPCQADALHKDDYIFGFHKYVAREAVAEMEGAFFRQTATLDMWQLDTQQIIAVLRGGRNELNEPVMEAVQELSLETPNTIYAMTRSEDEARIKIMGGVVSARVAGPGHLWSYQPIE